MTMGCILCMNINFLTYGIEDNNPHRDALGIRVKGYIKLSGI